MTTATAPRPQATPAVRPSAPGAGAPAAVTIDPIKLLQKHKWALIVATVTGIGLGIAGHFLLLAFYPVYSAQILWECYNQEREIGEIGAAQTNAEELDKFMATQAQLMRSDGVVDMAVTDPALERNARSWRDQFVRGGNFDTAKAAKRLQGRLSAGIVGDSNLVRLSFWSTDKDNATALVKIVADVYERARQVSVTREQSKRQDLLRRAIDDTTKRIEAVQRERATLMQESDLDSLETQASSAQQTMRLLSEQLTQARSNREIYSSQLQKLRAQLESQTGVTFDDTIRMEVENDPVILSMKQDINRLDGALKGMKVRGIGEGHPSYKQVESQLTGMRQSYDAEYEKMLRRTFDGRIDQLQTAINATAAQEAEVVAKLEEEKRRANELVTALAKVQDIKDEIAHLNKVKTTREDELRNLLALVGLDSTFRIRIVQDARIPRDVAFPKIYIMVPLGLILVFGLVAGVIVLVEIVDQRVKGPSDLAMMQRVRCLGIVPHTNEDPQNPQRVETVFRDQPSGVLAESFRQTRGVVLKRMQQSGYRSLVVLGGLPGSGATSVALNLALSAAAAEHRVLLVDGNFRRPGIHRVLGLPEQPGLADVLAGAKSLEDAAASTDIENLRVLTAGTPAHRTFERLGTDAMGRVLADAARDYDLVIVDAAPAVVAGDALALANRVDASMLVVRALREKRGMVVRLRNELSECRAEFLGVVINGVRSAAGGYMRGNIQATHQYQTGKD